MVWYSHLVQNFPQFIVIHTVKGFGIVNTAEIDVFLKKAMAPHSSTLAWKIPGTEEPGRLQSMGSLSRTRLSDFTFTFISAKLRLQILEKASEFQKNIYFCFIDYAKAFD